MISEKDKQKFRDQAHAARAALKNFNEEQLVAAITAAIFELGVRKDPAFAASMVHGIVETYAEMCELERAPADD